jgi:hypothetical protein
LPLTIDKLDGQSMESVIDVDPRESLPALINSLFYF